MRMRTWRMKSPLRVGNLPCSEASRRVGNAASVDIERRRKCSRWQRVKVKTEMKARKRRSVDCPTGQWNCRVCCCCSFSSEQYHHQHHHPEQHQNEPDAVLVVLCTSGRSFLLRPIISPSCPFFFLIATKATTIFMATSDSVAIVSHQA